MVEIDIRKLISFGKGSFVISIPKGWVTKNRLKKGDLISLNDEGYELVISSNSTTNSQDQKEISIQTAGKPMDHIKTEIVSAYLNCFDTIDILFDKNFSEISSL